MGKSVLVPVFSCINLISAWSFFSSGTKRDFHNATSLYVTAWSLKRKIQTLRIIEAVRHHLATHDGRLPASLDELEDVSIPVDPLTDQPFGWKVDGKTAMLKTPQLPSEVVVPGSGDDIVSTLEYRLQVK